MENKVRNCSVETSHIVSSCEKFNYAWWHFYFIMIHSTIRKTPQKCFRSPLWNKLTCKQVFFFVFAYNSLKIVPFWSKADKKCLEIQTLQGGILFWPNCYFMVLPEGAGGTVFSGWPSVHCKVCEHIILGKNYCICMKNTFLQSRILFRAMSNIFEKFSVLVKSQGHHMTECWQKV